MLSRWLLEKFEPVPKLGQLEADRTYVVLVGFEAERIAEFN